jgi:thioredoxin reductase (NADPH)
MQNRNDSPGPPGHNDVLIIGGGPAGLTAALYLARYHLGVLVIDNGRSRAAGIPMSHNLPGHPTGIGGRDLLARMRSHAEQYGARIITGHADALARTENGFAITLGNPAQRLHAPAVLLATGVRNLRPEMPEALHDEALARGLIRYCPICDGHEVTDARIAVIGSGPHGAKEALFLRSYTADLTLVAPYGPHDLDVAQRAELATAGIAIIDGPATEFALLPTAVAFHTAHGRQQFDTLYPALGSQIHATLARALGADLGEDGSIRTDSHQRTSIPGLYAAGDVVLGLDQISHAIGEAGVAATAIRNDLAETRRLWR